MNNCKSGRKLIKSVMSIFLAVLLSFSPILVYATGSTLVEGALDGNPEGYQQAESIDILEASADVLDASMGILDQSVGFLPTNIELGASEDDEANFVVVEISSEAELRALASRVNGGDDMKGHLVKLTNNINIDEQVLWVPIGNDAIKPFSGVFDGQGFEIGGIKVDKDVKGGLFGYLVDAKIRNLTITTFKAPSSTAGLFYSAVRTNIEMSRSGNETFAAVFSRSARRNLSVWDGDWTDTDRTWYDNAGPGQTEFTLKHARELAGMVEILDGSDDFEGMTVILDADFDMSNGSWVPIGEDLVGLPFNGRFIGNGATISGISDALFGVTDNATITKINIIDSHITGARSDEGVGILANRIGNSQVSQIHIKNSSIEAIGYATGDGGMGGAIGTIESVAGGGEPSTVSQILVENTGVKGNLNVGGVIGFADASSISECVVYGGKLENTGAIDNLNLTGGIVASFSNQSSMLGGAMKDCLVVGLDMGGQNYFAGLTWLNNETVTVSDSIVADIKTSSTNFTDVNTFIGVGTTYILGGTQNILTDSDLGFRLVEDGSTMDPYINADGVTGVYWDNSTEHGDSPKDGIGGNQGMNSSTIADGKWSPNPNGWKAIENFNPQLKSLSTKTWNDSVPYISAIASTTLNSGNVDENYKTGLGQVILPPSINIEGIGTVPVEWKGYQDFLDIQIRGLNTPNGLILSAIGDSVTIPSIRAEIGDYKKEFKSVTIADTTLEFSHSVPSENETVEADKTKEIVVYFDEHIEANSLASGKLVDIQVIRGTEPVTIEVVSLDPIEAGPKYKIDTEGTKGKATFKVSKLQPGNDYKIVIPKDAFIQKNNDKATSEEIEINFATVPVGKPLINFKKDLIFALSHDLQASDLISNVEVKDFDGALMYDGANPSSSPVQATEYTGPNWNENDVDTSRNKIIDEIGSPEIVYVVSDKTVFDAATREASLYEVYVIAKNAEGKGSSKVMTFSIKGYPEWVPGHEPKDTVHVQWTDNKQTFMDAAKQKALAQISQKNKAPLPSIVSVEFDEVDWANSLLIEDGPTSIHVEVVASDPSGTTDIRVGVMVYLDKPLYWTTTPSPVTMYLTTKAQVEKRINIAAGNFDEKIAKYDHWENDYRKPGTYYVDVYSDEQVTTKCQKSGCTANHPSSYVNDTFIVNVIDTPGYAIPSYWGLSAAELLKFNQENTDFESSYVYSKNVVQLKPTNYRMPAFVPEALRHQAYGRMEINYNDYRWNLYSHTLDTRYLWSDEYNLQADISQVANDIDDAVQIKFNHSGRLFGAVEFDINLDNAKELASKLPKKDLGLYRYDGVENKLVLVSNVVVEDGKWASALINEIYPTTYVLKSKGTNDVMGDNSVESLSKFYMDTKVFKDGIVSDGDAKLVNLPNSSKEFEKLYYSEADDVNGSSKTIIIASVIAIVTGMGSVTAVLYLRKKKGER